MLRSSEDTLNAVAEGLDLQPGHEVRLFRSEPHGLYTCRISNAAGTAYVEGWSAVSLADAMSSALSQAGW